MSEARAIIHVSGTRYVRGDIADEMREVLEEMTTAFNPRQKHIMDKAKQAIAKAKGEAG